MNNSIFGKSMQNVKKISNVKLVTKFDDTFGVYHYLSIPNFYDRGIFDDHCTAIEMIRCKNFFYKPIIVGFSVLDLSKTQWYKFHYEYMKKKFTNEILSLAYTYTNSLIY